MLASVLSAPAPVRSAQQARQRAVTAALALVLTLASVALLGNRLSLTVSAVETPIQTTLASHAALPVVPAEPSRRALMQLPTVGSFMPFDNTWRYTFTVGVVQAIAPYRQYLLRYAFSMGQNTFVKMPNTLAESLESQWGLGNTFAGPQLAPGLSYGFVLGLQFVIYFIIGLFLSTFGCFFWCSRCCGCCCCCCKQGHRAINPKGYSLCNRMCVWLFLLLFAAGMGMGVLLGFSSSQLLSTGVNRVFGVPSAIATGLGNRLTNLSLALDTFGVSTTARINSLRGLLNGLGGVMPIVNSSVAAVQNVTTEFNVVSALVAGLDTNVTQIKEILANLESSGLSGVPASSSIPTIPPSTVATVQNAAAQAQQAVSQVSGLSSTVSNQIQSVNSTVNNVLNSATATLLQILNSTKQMLSFPQQILSGADSTISSMGPVVSMGLAYQEWAFFGIFVAVESLIFWVLLSGLCQCCVCWPRFCGCWMSFWGFTFFFWLFLFIALFFVLGIVLGDVCSNITGVAYAGLEMAGMSPSATMSFGPVNISLVTTIFNMLNCSGNGNIVDMFGLGSYFNLSAQFSVGSIFSFSFAGANFTTYLDMLNQFQNVSGFNFTALRAGFNASATALQIDAVRANVSTVTLGAGTQANAEARLVNLQVMTGVGLVTFANYTNIDPNSYPSNVQAAIVANKTAIQVFLVANNTVNNLLGNLTTINDKILAIPVSLDRIDLAGVNVNKTVAAVRGYILQAKALQDDLLANVSGAVGILDLLQVDLDVMKRDVGSCAWIGVQYQQLTTGLCTELGGGFDVLWLALLTLTLGLFACVVIGVFAHQRWGRSPEWAETNHPDNIGKVKSKGASDDVEQGEYGAPPRSAPRAIPMQPMAPVQQVPVAYGGAAPGYAYGYGH